MTRFTHGCVASFAVLCVTTAMPLLAQESGTAVIRDSPGPSGQQSTFDYPPPPSPQCPPAPIQKDCQPQSIPGDSDMPFAPPSPSDPFADSPESSGAQQPSDSQFPSDMQLPNDEFQNSDFNSLPPDMATPTFNPSSGMPTTAATSADPIAPNFIGDLFGTVYGAPVPVAIDNFYGFGDIGGGVAPSFDTTSGSAYSSMNPGSTLFIGRTQDSMDALTSMGMSLSGTTTNSQSSITAADSSLSNPVAIQNNGSVEAAVGAFAATLHGPGSTNYIAGNSSMELNPIPPITSPTTGVAPQGFWNYDYVVLSEVAGLSNPGAAPGAAVGRQKLTENSSPIPQDRVFVNYSYFHNTPLLNAGVNVNRVTPGFEKTFFDGNASIEVRAPFATTLDSDIMAGGLSDTSNAQMGNLTVYFKTLLWDAGFEALSAGFGLTFPTADDVTVRTAGGTPLLDIQNESIHFLPFVAGLYMPSERCFMQAILQLDIDPNGNSMRFSDFNAGVPTGTLLPVGRPNDADYVFLDLNIGYWIYRAPVGGACCYDECGSGGGLGGWIQGIAPIMELHYNSTFDAADRVFTQRGTSANGGNIDLWNFVLGTTIQCHHNATMTLGYATPIGDRQYGQFDSEFRAVLNWYFGGPDHVHSCRRF